MLLKRLVLPTHFWVASYVTECVSCPKTFYNIMSLLAFCFKEWKMWGRLLFSWPNITYWKWNPSTGLHTVPNSFDKKYGSPINLEAKIISSQRKWLQYSSFYSTTYARRIQFCILLIWPTKSGFQVSIYMVLRAISTFKISNTRKDSGLDSKIYVQIIWHTHFFPLSALIKSLFWDSRIASKFPCQRVFSD